MSAPSPSFRHTNLDFLRDVTLRIVQPRDLSTIVDMTELPRRLRAFVERNVLSRPAGVTHVVFEQTGEMRLKEGGKWLPFSAEQRASSAEVEFVWHARVKMAPLLTAVVEDAFEGGRGRLDVKMWGAVPFVHEEGPAIDQGEAQRYLAELAWNPAAFVENGSLRYAEGPDGSVRVWVANVETYVDLYFDDDGDIVRTYTLTRSRGEDGPAPWEGICGGYRDFGGLRVPSSGEVSWHLPGGKFEYWRGDFANVRWETLA